MLQNVDVIRSKCPVRRSKQEENFECMSYIHFYILHPCLFLALSAFSVSRPLFSGLRLNGDSRRVVQFRGEGRFCTAEVYRRE
jgi:hypothetical protein